MKNSNLVGLLLVWYYSDLEQLGASKNQVNKYFPCFHQVKFHFVHECPLNDENTDSNNLYKWKHQVEHHPSKTSDFLLLLFLEVWFVKVFGFSTN
jgi:hypothetical protein